MKLLSGLVLFLLMGGIFSACEEEACTETITYEVRLLDALPDSGFVSIGYLDEVEGDIQMVWLDSVELEGDSIWSTTVTITRDDDSPTAFLRAWFQTGDRGVNLASSIYRDGIFCVEDKSDTINRPILAGRPFITFADCDMCR